MKIKIYLKKYILAAIIQYKLGNIGKISALTPFKNGYFNFCSLARNCRAQKNLSLKWFNCFVVKILILF